MMPFKVPVDNVRFKAKSMNIKLGEIAKYTGILNK